MPYTNILFLAGLTSLTERREPPARKFFFDSALRYRRTEIVLTLGPPYSLLHAIMYFCHALMLKRSFEISGYSEQNQKVSTLHIPACTVYISLNVSLFIAFLLCFYFLLFSLFVYYSWWRGVVVSALSSINEVNQHRARLLLGWVTVCGQVNRLGM